LILDRVEQILARSVRSQTPLKVLFLDLDNFKDINDTLGHSAGDELLHQGPERAPPPRCSPLRESPPHDRNQPKSKRQNRSVKPLSARTSMLTPSLTPTTRPKSLQSACSRVITGHTASSVP
jgi:hypothetical protein